MGKEIEGIERAPSGLFGMIVPLVTYIFMLLSFDPSLPMMIPLILSINIHCDHELRLFCYLYRMHFHFCALETVKSPKSSDEMSASNSHSDDEVDHLQRSFQCEKEKNSHCDMAQCDVNLNGTAMQCQNGLNERDPLQNKHGKIIQIQGQLIEKLRTENQELRLVFERSQRNILQKAIDCQKRNQRNVASPKPNVNSECRECGSYPNRERNDWSNPGHKGIHGMPDCQCNEHPNRNHLERHRINQCPNEVSPCTTLKTKMGSLWRQITDMDRVPGAFELMQQTIHSHNQEGPCQNEEIEFLRNKLADMIMLRQMLKCQQIQIGNLKKKEKACHEKNKAVEGVGDRHLTGRDCSRRGQDDETAVVRPRKLGYSAESPVASRRIVITDNSPRARYHHPDDRDEDHMRIYRSPTRSSRRAVTTERVGNRSQHHEDPNALDRYSRATSYYPGRRTRDRDDIESEYTPRRSTRVSKRISSSSEHSISPDESTIRQKVRERIRKSRKPKTAQSTIKWASDQPENRSSNTYSDDVDEGLSTRGRRRSRRSSDRNTFVIRRSSRSFKPVHLNPKESVNQSARRTCAQDSADPHSESLYDWNNDLQSVLEADVSKNPDRSRLFNVLEDELKHWPNISEKAPTKDQDSKRERTVDDGRSNGGSAGGWERKLKELKDLVRLE